MLHFIVNPASSTGNGGKIWKEAESKLIKANTPYRLYLTTGTGSAKLYASEITATNEPVIIVVLGGDGTINEVLTGIRDFGLVTLGYIPAGSSNDLARDLMLTRDPESALSSILHPKEYAYMDVGIIKYQNEEKNFGVSTGIGFDAAVCHEALHSKIKNVLNKLHLGKLTYVGIALKQLAKTQKQGCTIILDDTRKIRLDRFYFVTCMIHKYEGGSFMFCPDADYKDGILNVCVAGNLSKPRVLRILPTAYKGKHTHFSGITTYQAKKVTIVTDVPCPVHADGESCGIQSTITMTQDVKQLRVIIR